MKSGRVAGVVVALIVAGGLGTGYALGELASPDTVEAAPPADQQRATADPLPTVSVTPQPTGQPPATGTPGPVRSEQGAPPGAADKPDPKAAPVRPTQSAKAQPEPPAEPAAPSGPGQRFADPVEEETEPVEPTDPDPEPPVEPVADENEVGWPACSVGGVTYTHGDAGYSECARPRLGLNEPEPQPCTIDGVTYQPDHDLWDECLVDETPGD